MSWVDELAAEIAGDAYVGVEKTADNLRSLIQRTDKLWENGRTAILKGSDVIAIESAIRWLEIMKSCVERAQEQSE